MTTETKQGAFCEWAVLELLGHRQPAGLVREVELFGGKMLRIDIPGEGGATVATQFYGASSVYCLTPTTEEVARAVAKGSQPQPVTRWELPAPAAQEPQTQREGVRHWHDDDRRDCDDDQDDCPY